MIKIFSDVLYTSEYKSGRLRKLKALLSPSVMCMVIYRVSVAFYVLRIPLIPRVLWWLNFIIFKVDIDYRAKLLGAVYMPHPMGIVVGEHVELTQRSRLKLMQGATIGGDLGRIDERHGRHYHQPIIDGNAFIGINSIVAGPISVSGNVFVSSSSIVSRSAKDVLCYAVNKTKDLSDNHLKELRV